MGEIFGSLKNPVFLSILLCLSLVTLNSVGIALGSEGTNEITELQPGPSDKLETDVKSIPFKIIYETYRETDGKENWELFIMNADGSNATNLTRTPDVDELYPHASPDGTRICFVTDEGTNRRDKVRSIYYMNIDGTGRVKVADNARQPCWSPDGKIAYVKGEYDRYTIEPYATKGVFFYDLADGTHKQHPNKDLQHIYNMSMSPNGKWFIASATGGMGFDHTIIAFEANGSAVFDLARYGIKGCRPDISSDGRTVGWAEISEVDVFIADIDLALSMPRVVDPRGIVRCKKGNCVNHTDFSPDGRYIAFGYGPAANYSVGSKTPGWNICIADMTGKWIQITTDGNHNKEPDWVPVREADQ